MSGRLRWMPGAPGMPVELWRTVTAGATADATETVAGAAGAGGKGAGAAFRKAVAAARRDSGRRWRSETRKKLMKTATRYEWKVYKALPDWLRKRAVRQRPFHHLGRTYFFDIYLPCAKAAIEVDGGYHKERVAEDVLRDAVASLYGIRTFRITNEDASNPVLLRIFVAVVEDYCLRSTGGPHGAATKKK